MAFWHHVCFHGKPRIFKKKRRYDDRSGFPPNLPHPQKDIHWQGSIGTFKEISENWRSFLIPTGFANAAGHEPRERDKILELPDLQDQFDRSSTKPIILKNLHTAPGLHPAQIWPVTPHFHGLHLFPWYSSQQI